MRHTYANVAAAVSATSGLSGSGASATRLAAAGGAARAGRGSASPRRGGGGASRTPFRVGGIRSDIRDDGGVASGPDTPVARDRWRLIEQFEDHPRHAHTAPM